MNIQHNLSAMNSQRHLRSIGQRLDQARERISSGMRINHGGDDAYGLSIAAKMEARNAGLAMARQNVQDGIALLRTAEGGLDQIGRMLERLEELGVRAATGSLTDTDRVTVMDEVRQLRGQIDGIAGTTEIQQHPVAGRLFVGPGQRQWRRFRFR